MGKTREPTITENKTEDFTAVTFHPDLSKFKMNILDKDTVDLFTRRAYDIAATSKGVKVILNGKRVPVSFCCGVARLNSHPNSHPPSHAIYSYILLKLCCSQFVMEQIQLSQSFYLVERKNIVNKNQLEV